MTIRDLLGMLARGIAIGFLLDVLRRCWIVEAWTIVPIVAGLLIWLLLSTVRRWRALTRNRNTGFIRPNPPPFPEQAKRDIR